MTVPLLPRLRVLAVLPAGVVGGAELWLLELLAATARCDVQVLLLQDGPVSAALAARGIPVQLLEVGRTPAGLAAGVLRVAAAVRAHQPDVVLANGVVAAVVGAPAAAAVGRPLVWVKHDHSYDRVAAVLGRLCTRVVATAEEVAIAAGRPDAVVIEPPRPSGVPLSRGDAAAAWAARGVVLDGRLTAVAVGRLVPYKGVDDAVRALALPQGQGWRLVVVGEDDPSAPGTETSLRALADDLGVGERVVFAGSVPGAGRLLAAFDALLLLTKPTGDRRVPDREGFGATALEAMVCGVPVIAVGGGPVERRLAGQAGLVVRPGRPQDVATALEQLADPGRRARAGRAGRTLTEGHPDAAEAADRLVRVLAEAAGRPGAGLVAGPAMTVVVPTLDDGPALALLLDRVVPQLREGDALLVVDGGSSDGTAELVAERAEHDGRLALVDAPGTNIPAARNAAWEHVRTAWVAATDAGCLPSPGWLDALRAAAADGAPALVTGVYRPAVSGPRDAAQAAACYPDPRDVTRPTLLTRAYSALLGLAFDPSLPTNRSNAVRVDAARAVGGYDASLATAEDVTFGRALVAAGGRAVLSVPAEVLWEQRPTLRATAAMYRSYGRGGGLSGDRLLIGRDLARLLAYVAGPPLLLTRARRLVLAGALTYLSVPLARSARAEAPVATAVRLPLALALKDTTKALGCLEGLYARRSTR